jgi:uncharacterized protein (DUF2235 family)
MRMISLLGVVALLATAAAPTHAFAPLSAVPCIRSSSSSLSMKNIVICIDGTGCDFSGNKGQTNVARFFRCLEKSNRQLPFYYPGVGTLNFGGGLTPEKRIRDKLQDLKSGYSIEHQVVKAYKFLVNHWEPEDKIFLVGFSRGAYSVRALAGMLKHIGLLFPDNSHLDSMGWNMYSTYDYTAMRRFRYAFSRREVVPIHFMGVWDTVSSFGKMTNFRTLASTSSNVTNVHHIRHAMAIDEKRECFIVDLFSETGKEEHESFKQVWFAGVHGDVGGGFDDTSSSLSKISLEWMSGEAADLGCKFDYKLMNTFLGFRSIPYSKPDHMQKINNSMTWFYKIVEFLPRRAWNLEKDRMAWIWPNLFKPRSIPSGSLFHESVKSKLEDDQTYRPDNLKLESIDETQVVKTNWTRDSNWSGKRNRKRKHKRKANHQPPKKPQINPAKIWSFLSGN